MGMAHPTYVSPVLWRPRHRNQEADRLCNAILDARWAFLCLHPCIDELLAAPHNYLAHSDGGWRECGFTLQVSRGSGDCEVAAFWGTWEPKATDSFSTEVSGLLLALAVLAA